MSSRAAALIALAVLAAGCTDARAPDLPAPTEPDAALLAELSVLAAAPVMVVETDMGTFRALLYTDRMPITAGRIGELASSGFYDGVLIHRVVDDFVIQGGDPTGTGEGGSGQMIPFETHPDLPFGIGALGMAQWTPGTADSQWFVTEKPAPHLNEGTDDPVASRLGPYPMFGEVVEGMDVVRAITEVETIPGWDRPMEEIRVKAASVATTAGLDLLALPHLLEPNLQLAGGTFHLEQPLHLYATHPFVIQVTVATAPTASETIELVFRQEGVADVPVFLEPIDDGTVFEGRVMLTAGAWEETLRVGEAEDSWDRTVIPWSPEYGAFLAR